MAEEAMRSSGGSPEARTALAFVLAEEDVGVARRHLLGGDQDAPLLLAQTFISDGASNVAPPDAVLRHLEPLANGGSLGRSYYPVVLQRSAPAEVLIPGDWQKMPSPRTARASAIVKHYEWNSSGVTIVEILLFPRGLYPGLAVGCLVATLGFLAITFGFARKTRREFEGEAKS
jgi:hypothetical protein